MIKHASQSIIAATALALASLAAYSAAAIAGPSVEMACASDYFAYCSKHDPDSPGVRACMRANGARLSQRCVKALVAAGEVSKSEVSSRSANAR